MGDSGVASRDGPTTRWIAPDDSVWAWMASRQPGRSWAASRNGTMTSIRVTAPLNSLVSRAVQSVGVPMGLVHPEGAGVGPYDDDARCTSTETRRSPWPSQCPSRRRRSSRSMARRSPSNGASAGFGPFRAGHTRRQRDRLPRSADPRPAARPGSVRSARCPQRAREFQPIDRDAGNGRRCCTPLLRSADVADQRRLFATWCAIAVIVAAVPTVGMRRRVGGDQFVPVRVSRPRPRGGVRGHRAARRHPPLRYARRAAGDWPTDRLRRARGWRSHRECHAGDRSYWWSGERMPRR